MRAVAGIFVFSIILGCYGCKSDKIAVDDVMPAFGNVSGNDDVIITGNGFQPGMTVRFGTRQVSNVVLDSPSRIRVKTPAGPEGKVDVVITREDGVTFGVKNGFSYKKEGG